MLIGGGGGGFPSIPGDPSGIRSAATQIGQLAAQVGSQGAVLTNTAGGIVGSAWTGTAANQFESMIGTFGGVHREVDSSLGALAGALSQFASVLQACQEQMAQAQANMSSAQQDAQSGAAQVDATMPESEAASDPGMAQDRAAALASVSDEYSARSQQATNLAGDANDRYQAAVSALQGHLSQASADGHQTSSVVSGIGNALGIPNTVVAALATVAMARSASRFVTLAPEFDAALAREFDEVVGPAGLAFDRGEISLADLSDAADSFLESAAGAVSTGTAPATQSMKAASGPSEPPSPMSTASSMCSSTCAMPKRAGGWPEAPACSGSWVTIGPSRTPMRVAPGERSSRDRPRSTGSRPVV